MPIETDFTRENREHGSAHSGVDGATDGTRSDLTSDSTGTRLSLMKTIKISEAKRNFSKVFARAKRGETVILQNGEDFVQLVPWSPPEPIQLHPPGYFAADEEVVRLRNSLGEESEP